MPDRQLNERHPYWCPACDTPRRFNRGIDLARHMRQVHPGLVMTLAKDGVLYFPPLAAPFEAEQLAPVSDYDAAHFTVAMRAFAEETGRNLVSFAIVLRLEDGALSIITDRGALKELPADLWARKTLAERHEYTRELAQHLREAKIEEDC